MMEGVSMEANGGEAGRALLFAEQEVQAAAVSSHKVDGIGIVLVSNSSRCYRVQRPPS